MHELSIAMCILDAAEEEAEKYGGVPVAAVHLKIGDRSGVVADALSAAFELAREGSPMPACRLVIESSEGTELLVSALEFAD